MLSCFVLAVASCGHPLLGLLVCFLACWLIQWHAPGGCQPTKGGTRIEHLPVRVTVPHLFASVLCKRSAVQATYISTTKGRKLQDVVRCLLSVTIDL